MFSDNATDRKFDELQELTTELSQYVHGAAAVIWAIISRYVAHDLSGQRRYLLA